MGSAMVFLAIMIGMLFMAGANWKWLLGIFGGGLVAGIGYIIGIWKFGWWSPLMKHQLNRFLVLFDSTIDRQGVGWNAWQAKIAIGNGGFFVVTMFFFHVFENVGMNIGIMPIAGIPLPFISYGGSAVLANFMGIALLENIYMRRESLSFRE